MTDDYAACYLDGMKAAGYTVSDFMADMFCACFSECAGSGEYRAAIQQNGMDFPRFCAAYAQLKTSFTLGCSNDAPYDIAGFLHLSRDEFHFFAAILPPRLAHLAKGACSRLRADFD